MPLTGLRNQRVVSEDRNRIDRTVIMLRVERRRALGLIVPEAAEVGRQQPGRHQLAVLRRLKARDVLLHWRVQIDQPFLGSEKKSETCERLRDASHHESSAYSSGNSILDIGVTQRARVDHHPMLKHCRGQTNIVLIIVARAKRRLDVDLGRCAYGKLLCPDARVRCRRPSCSLPAGISGGRQRNAR